MFRKLRDRFWSSLSARDRYLIKAQFFAAAVFFLAVMTPIRWADDLFDNKFALVPINIVLLTAMGGCVGWVGSYLTWLKYDQFDDD